MLRAGPDPLQTLSLVLLPPHKSSRRQLWGGGKGWRSNSYLPCANTVFYSFNHTGEADFKFSVLGCMIPTETHPLDAHPIAQQLPSTIGTAGFPLLLCRLRRCRAAGDPFHAQKRSPTAEREQNSPSEEVPHLLVASKNTQAHARTEHMRPPILLPFGTRLRGWSPQRQWRQRAGCLQGNNSALSSVTFGFSTQVSTRCLEKVMGEGGRQKYFVFFQPGWSNSMTVTPQISFLALRETGHQERQNSSMEGCRRELLSLAFPQMYHQSQTSLSITDYLSLPCAKQPSKHRTGRDGGFVSLNAFASPT